MDPALLATAPGIYRVKLEGCNPRQATYTVRRRERLFREQIAELEAIQKNGKKADTRKPGVYSSMSLAAAILAGRNPCAEAWARFAAERGIDDEYRHYFIVQPESGPQQDYLDIEATSKGDAFAKFLALNGSERTERKWTAELLPPAGAGEEQTPAKATKDKKAATAAA